MSRLAISLLLLALGCAPAWALKSDRTKQAELESDQAERDMAKGISVYTGNVVLTQGTTRLTADKMTVHTNAKGELVKAVAEGREVTFRELLDGQQEYIDARAPYMEYVATDGGHITLKGGATLTQGRNSFSGETIRYDMSRELITASGDPQGRERIRMIYVPEQKPDQPATTERPRQ
jgi:lipopolysaccharide transport periplasmic protein LptA